MSLSIKTILSDLRSPDEKQRLSAVTLLVRSGDKRAIPFLEHSASDDKSPRVRYYARKGIQYILKKNRVGAGTARAGESPAVGRASDGGEGKKKHPGSSLINIAMLSPSQVKENLSHEDQWTRLQTVKSIQRHEIVDYTHLLIERLGLEKNRQVLSALLLAVGALGGEAAIAALVPFLKNEDSRVRANAIEALDAVGDQSCYIHLVPFLRDPDNRCRANAVLALRKYGRVNVFKTLEEMLRSDEVWMQDSATFVLGRMGGGPRVFDLLKLSLSSGFMVVRRQAVHVLEKLAARGNHRAKGMLERLEKQGERDPDNGEEELFEQLEGLEQLKSSVGRHNEFSGHLSRKTPEQAYEALVRLSASADSDESAVKTPAERLEKKAANALEALRRLSSLTVTPAKSPVKALREIDPDSLQAVSGLAED